MRIANDDLSKGVKSKPTAIDIHCIEGAPITDEDRQWAEDAIREDEGG